MPSHRLHPLRHVHFRVSQSEYRFLVDIARQEEDTIASVLRRLIRQASRAQASSAASGSMKPEAEPVEIVRRHVPSPKKGGT